LGGIADEAPRDEKRGRMGLAGRLGHGGLARRKAWGRGAQGEIVEQDASQGENPAHSAAKNGDLIGLKLLAAEGGVDWSAEDAQGQTPLMLAAEAGALECVQFLSTLGDPARRSAANGRDALMWAAASAQAGCVEWLASRCDPLASDATGWTALTLAVCSNRKEEKEDCLRALAPVSDARAGPEGRDALMLAAGRKAPNLAKLLLPFSDPTRRCGETQKTRKAIDFAARERDVESLRALLPFGGADEGDSAGATPLMHGALAGSVEMIELLAPFSIVDQRGPRKKSALMIAAENGHEPAIEALLRAGADPDAQDEDGYCALALAIEMAQEGAFDILAPKTRLDARTGDGLSLTHVAAAGIGAEIFKKTLALRPGETRAASLEGLTPLMCAAQWGLASSAEALIPMSNIHAKDALGKDAFDHVLERSQARRSNRAGAEIRVSDDVFRLMDALAPFVDLPRVEEALAAAEAGGRQMPKAIAAREARLIGQSVDLGRAAGGGSAPETRKPLAL
jgi:ankyrin repeat protein